MLHMKPAELCTLFLQRFLLYIVCTSGTASFYSLDCAPLRPVVSSFCSCSIKLVLFSYQDEDRIRYSHPKFCPTSYSFYVLSLSDGRSVFWLLCLCPLSPKITFSSTQLMRQNPATNESRYSLSWITFRGLQKSVYTMIHGQAVHRLRRTVGIFTIQPILPYLLVVLLSFFPRLPHVSPAWNTLVYCGWESCVSGWTLIGRWQKFSICLIYARKILYTVCVNCVIITPLSPVFVTPLFSPHAWGKLRS